MIQVIDQRYRDPIQCCQDLFRDWLGNIFGVSPRDWTTLLSKLKEIRQLRAVTEEIEKELLELKLYVTSVMYMLSLFYFIGYREEGRYILTTSNFVLALYAIN